MIKKPIKLILFFSSYIPLFMIFIIQDSFSSKLINYCLTTISVISLLMLTIFIYIHKRVESEYINIEGVNLRDSEATSYIVTYIIPFLSMNLTTFEDKISLLILFVVLAVIYINSSMIYINPLLNCVGYHIFEIKDNSGNTLLLLTKDKFLSSGRRIKAINISSNVYLKED